MKRGIVQSHERLLALDGLRAVSILLVVLSHIFGLTGVSQSIPGGFGVTIFFFISGFIITRLLLKEDVETGRLSLKSFYIRRFFRLAPALLVYVGISTVAFSALGLHVPGSDIAASLFYYANYHAIYAGFHNTIRGSTVVLSPLGITWSLAIEEHFYFLFPMILMTLRKRTDRLLTSLCGFVIIVVTWRIFLVYFFGLSSLPNYRIYMGTDTRLDSIAYGCLLSVLFHRAEINGKGNARKFLDLLQGSIGLCVSAGLILLSLILRGPEFRETIRYSIQGIALAPLFCALFWSGSAPRWLQYSLSNRTMTFLGTISYSMYLYHFLAVGVTQWVLRNATSCDRVVLSACLTFAGSLFSYYLVEGPPRRFGSRWAARIKGAISPSLSQRLIRSENRPAGH
jgi:peptidoglycan/LPS O-acetylase OafA/YrhL